MPLVTGMIPKGVELVGRTVSSTLLLLLAFYYYGAAVRPPVATAWTPASVVVVGGFRPTALTRQQAARITTHGPFPTTATTRRHDSTPSTARALQMIPDWTSSATTVIGAVESTTSSDESWRQYVPLIVSFGVITDIVLGSPLANRVIGLLNNQNNNNNSNPGKEDDDNNDITGARAWLGGKKSDAAGSTNSKERIDTQLLARRAIEKAQNTLELQRYLRETKTDADRMKEMKRKMDQQTAQIDEKLRARRESPNE